VFDVEKEIMSQNQKKKKPKSAKSRK